MGKIKFPKLRSYHVVEYKNNIARFIEKLKNLAEQLPTINEQLSKAIGPLAELEKSSIRIHPQALLAITAKINRVQTQKRAIAQLDDAIDAIETLNISKLNKASAFLYPLKEQLDILRKNLKDIKGKLHALTRDDIKGFSNNIVVNESLGGKADKNDNILPRPDICEDIDFAALKSGRSKRPSRASVQKGQDCATSINCLAFGKNDGLRGVTSNEAMDCTMKKKHLLPKKQNPQRRNKQY